MGIPAEQLILADSEGRPVEVDALVERLRGEPQRILADDEVGVVTKNRFLGNIRNGNSLRGLGGRLPATALDSRPWTL